MKKTIIIFLVLLLIPQISSLGIRSSFIPCSHGERINKTARVDMTQFGLFGQFKEYEYAEFVVCDGYFEYRGMKIYYKNEVKK